MAPGGLYGKINLPTSVYYFLANRHAGSKITAFCKQPKDLFSKLKAK